EVTGHRKSSATRHCLVALDVFRSLRAAPGVPNLRILLPRPPRPVHPRPSVTPSPMSDLVLRPRSATELIDAAFQVYRRAPVPFMVAMALIYVPWLAIRLIFSLNIPETPDQFTPEMMRVAFISAAGGVVIYGLAGGAVSILARA